MAAARDTCPYEEKSPKNSDAGPELLQEFLRIQAKGIIKIGRQSEDRSNLCVTTNERNEILVGTENGSHLFSEDGQLISSFLLGNNVDENEVPSAIFSRENEHIIYLASNNSIFTFDMRNGEKIIHTFQANEDEINQLVACKNHLAACDDSGEVKIFDTTNNRVLRTLRNKHKNICSSLCFRNGFANELVSGGLDCQLILWNYSKIKALNSSNTQDIFKASADDSGYMFNPPLINAIDCTKDGTGLACSLGNGAIMLYEITKSRKLIPAEILKHHSSIGATSIKLLDFEDEHCLISGGNDCKLNVIKLASGAFQSDCNTKDKNSCKSINLSSKINHLTSFNNNEKFSILVCDQTSNLKCFELDLSVR
eukprot:Seg1244.2 transcript_id=Seg1244.2/GoldUCD/mRNA.D3Y31 product="WD repeat-containing protein 53" protein_id=Seg1244.2/GoldUCD/D3Y31